MLQSHVHRSWLCAIYFVTAALVLGFTTTAHAQVKPADIIDSHMVLQRNMPVPIWGKAKKGETVTVKFRDQTKTTVAEDSGAWSLTLEPLTAGGPDTMTITGSNSEPITLEDVLVGEVWLGSGQSNMNHSASLIFKDADEQKQPRDAQLERDVAQTWPQVRLFLRSAKVTKPWCLATPENSLGFSGLLFEFGLQLQKELKVPIGLIQGAEGGTASGVWIPKKAFDQDDAIQKAVQEFTPKFEAKRRQALEELEKWKQTVATTQPKAVPPIRVPVAPSENAVIGQNYRRFIQANVPFAIRGVLWDQGESDTGIEGVNQYLLMNALIKSWRQAWGQGDFPWIYVQKPSGGGCALNPNDPLNERAVSVANLPKEIPMGFYGGRRRVMYDRIRDVPNTAMACTSDLGIGLHPLDKSAYATRAMRAALKQAYNVPIDIYGPTFKSMEVLQDGKVRIHYTNLGPGLTIPTGNLPPEPVAKSGNKKPAETPGPTPIPLQGFIIAGEDQQWTWAESKIDGDTVLVWSAKVNKPVAVRYGWGDRIPWATLFSKNGLPALPFRTDDWAE